MPSYPTLAKRHSMASTVLAVLLTAASGSLMAQAKKVAPAPPKAAAAPARPAAASAKPAGGAAASTAHPATTTASHTATTTTASHGATTTTAGHPATTTGAGAAHPGAATTAGRPGASTAAGRPGTPAAGGRPGGSPAARGGVPGVNHGAMAHAGPAGSHDRVGPHGDAVRTRADGRPSDVHARGMDIHHNLAGGRRVEMERPDHSRLVYERGRPGYIAHPYMYRGHEFARRSYYYNGRAYDRFYNHYAFRGVYLDVYAPVHYYGLGFYGWAYNPWAAPIAYGWGWNATPWYGFYGSWFTPYPVYATPSLWLTDYLIATSLQSAYEAHLAAQTDAAAAAGVAPPVPLSPETKAMVADEVRRQVALENAEAQANAQQKDVDPQGSSIARLLADGQPHVFVAGKELDLVDQNGTECAVTDGDVMQLKEPPASDATFASLTVLSSKGGVECHNMSTVTVAFDDMQEMQNHMRETVDQGLAELQAKQGKGGLPAAPASALAPPTTAAIAADAPPPDPAGAKELAAQAQDAEKAEQEALADTSGAAAPAGGAAAAPAATPQTIDVTPGMTTDQVVAAMGGQPTKIMNLGPKVIYVYPGLKITFKGGKVSDME